MDPISLNPTRQGGNKKTTIAIIIFLIAVAGVAGFFMLRQPEKKEQVKGAVVEKKVITPTPTEKPKIDKKSVRIEVLNGTGTPGQAAIVVDALEQVGYGADNIKAANADAFGDTITTITARDGFDDIASDIKSKLKESFSDVEIDSSHLAKDSEFDVSIVTGGKKFEEATPSATIAPTVSDETPTSTPSPTIDTTLTPNPTSTTPAQ